MQINICILEHSGDDLIYLKFRGWESHLVQYCTMQGFGFHTKKMTNIFLATLNIAIEMVVLTMTMEQSRPTKATTSS